MMIQSEMSIFGLDLPCLLCCRAFNIFKFLFAALLCLTRRSLNFNLVRLHNDTTAEKNLIVHCWKISRKSFSKGPFGDRAQQGHLNYQQSSSAAFSSEFAFPWGQSSLRGGLASPSWRMRCSSTVEEAGNRLGWLGRWYFRLHYEEPCEGTVND